MKKIILLAIGMTALNVNAQSNHKGCFFGLQASFVEGDHQWQTLFFQDDPYDENAGSASGDDTSIGAQLGCNFYEDEEWVLGAKLATTDHTINASHLYIGGTGFDNFVSYQTDDVISLIGKFGYKLSDKGLVYGNVGYTQASSRYNDDDPSPPVLAFQKSTSRDGYTLGVGYEHRINQTYSWFAEYNYTDFGKKSVLLIDNAEFMVDDYRARIDQDLAQFSVGINIHF